MTFPYKKKIILKKVNLVVWCDEDLYHLSSKVIVEKNNFAGRNLPVVSPSIRTIKPW